MTTAAMAVGSGTAANTSSTTKKDPAKEISDRFLSLLVAQMKNQDPLNPLENSEVTSQMAQINTVNGITQLNTSMQGMVQSFAAMQSMQAAALVGREVMAEGNRIELANGKAAGGYALEAAATGVRVNVLNASGELVYSADVGAQPTGTHRFEWDGTTTAGGKAPDGVYRFDVVASRPAGNSQASTYGISRVMAVRPDTAGTVLIDSQGNSLKLSDIKQFS